MAYLSLVDKAQEILGQVIQPGDSVIDATVGNGYDTVFLANAVGETGHVLGLDIQPESLENARRVLQQKKLQHRVTLLLHNHASVDECVPQAMQHRIKAVMFNLGYLPGGDKSVVTRSQSTTTALSSILPHLVPGGVLSIVAYRGHAGGQEEADAVLQWSSRLALEDRYAVHIHKPPTLSDKAPFLLIVKHQSA
jgi:predicted methyltransferase